MKIEIRTRYAIDDPEMKSDYCAVEIHIDGQLDARFGDHCHEKGYEQAMGWLYGFQTAVNIFDREATVLKISKTSVADYEV